MSFGGALREDPNKRKPVLHDYRGRLNVCFCLPNNNPGSLVSILLFMTLPPALLWCVCVYVYTRAGFDSTKRPIPFKRECVALNTDWPFFFSQVQTQSQE